MAFRNTHNMSDMIHYVFQILLIGEDLLSQSKILLRFCDDTYTDSYISNIFGFDYKINKISVGNKNVKLQIWQAQVDFNSRYGLNLDLPNGAHRGVHAYFVVIDLANISVDKIKFYINGIAKYNKDSRPVVIVGANADLLDSDQLAKNTEELKQIANQFDCGFAVVSAKHNQNIDELFVTASKHMIQIAEEEVPLEKIQLVIGATDNEIALQSLYAAAICSKYGVPEDVHHVIMQQYAIIQNANREVTARFSRNAFNLFHSITTTTVTTSATPTMTATTSMRSTNQSDDLSIGFFAEGDGIKNELFLFLDKEILLLKMRKSADFKINRLIDVLNYIKENNITLGSGQIACVMHLTHSICALAPSKSVTIPTSQQNFENRFIDFLNMEPALSKNELNSFKNKNDIPVLIAKINSKTIFNTKKSSKCIMQ